MLWNFYFYSTILFSKAKMAKRLNQNYRQKLFISIKPFQTNVCNSFAKYFSFGKKGFSFEIKLYIAKKKREIEHLRKTNKLIFVCILKNVNWCLLKWNFVYTFQPFPRFLCRTFGWQANNEVFNKTDSSIFVAFEVRQTKQTI